MDVTTTAIYVGLAILSLFIYAASPDFLFKGAFSSELVRDGEIWRLVTYPVVNPPSGDSLAFLWIIITLVFFWWIGHNVEEQVGRVPFTALLLVMTVLPAAIVSLVGVTNELDVKWLAFSFGLITLALALLVIFALENPQMRGIWGLPIWVFAAAYVGIEVLQQLGNRRPAQLLLTLLVIVVGVIGARQLGMLTDYSFIPVKGNYSRGSTAPYGGQPSRSKRKGSKRSKGGRKPSAGSRETVVAGPWAERGPSRLEQAELDVLLDKISESGIDSLSRQEKDRLNLLSKKMRES